jgi:hypothetical protein
MEVMMVRQGNDDDRLDALERAFVALRSELTAEMDRRFDRVDSRLDRVEDGIQSLQQTIIKLQQTMIVVGVGLAGTLAASLIAVLAAGA